MEIRGIRPWVIGCWAAVLIILLAHLLFLVSNSPVVALGVAFLLGWILPGVLLTLNWRLPGLDWAEVAGMSIALGLVWCLLLTWAVHLLPGAFTVRHLLSAYDAGLALLILILLLRPPVAIGYPPRRVWVHLVMLVILAALLRLPGLGYSEFHTDETVRVARAYESLAGQDDVLLAHKKGPAEILVALVPYAVLGTVDEGTARLPFALAGIGNVVLVYLLGRRLFAPEAGVATALLLAMNGYALSHTRIVAFEGLVLLMMTSSFFAAHEFSSGGNARWLYVLGLCTGAGMLAHYEFGMMALAILLLLVWGWRRSRTSIRVVMQAAGVFLVIVLTAYVPLALDRHFAGTQRYLDIIRGAGLQFNIPYFVENGTWYNSTYYFFGLVLLVVVGMVLGWRQVRLTAAALVLWFLPYLGMYILVVSFPGTHFYTMMVSWCLLGGYGLTRGLSVLRRPWFRWPAVAGSALWCALSVGYLYLAFFQQKPEYMQDYGANRLAPYWAPYGADVPIKPRYGFPNQAGWKVIGMLFDWNYLQGTYWSNERGRFLRWYLPGVGRSVDPDYYFVTKTVQMPNPRFDEGMLTTHQEVGVVLVHGEPKIHLYARNRGPFPYLVYEAETFAPVFDHTIPALPYVLQKTTQFVDFRWGDSIWLRGYDQDMRPVGPGDVLSLTLYWETSARIAEDYKVFVHLGREVIWGQHDAMPQQNTYPTSQWEVGEEVMDHVLMPIAPATPPSTYPVIVGMYHWEDGQRLPVYDEGGTPQGDLVALGTVQIH